MPEELLQYARWVSRLDFVALTEHDRALDDETWARIQGEVQHQYQPGHFVPLLGYEWTNNRYGHQNVYFPGTEGPLIRARGQDGEFITPSTLWNQWEQDGVDAFSIPHHVAVSQFAIDWAFYHPRFQPVSEVTSLWGNFLHYQSPGQTRISNLLPGRFLSEVLEDGYRLGFVGGSDSHDCRPGNPTFGGRVKSNVVGTEPMGQNPLAPPNVAHLGDDTCNTRGITAIWADALTRQSLWEAIRTRHTYATTGARISLRATVGNAMMGDPIRSADPTMEVEVIGTGLLAEVTVHCNQRTIFRTVPESDRVTFACALPEVSGPAFYYVRVRQRDGHQAWTSPFWRESGITRSKTAPVAIVAEMVPTYQASGPYRANAEAPAAELSVDRVGPGVFRIALAIQGKDWAQDVHGELAMVGAQRVRCRDHGLLTAKYGGDLYHFSGRRGSLQFYFPRKADRTETPGLEILVRQDNTQPTVHLSVEGISGISLGDRTLASQGVVIRLPQDLAVAPADEVLPWPDRERWSPRQESE